jgi:predicted nucleic acid-binding protein
MISKIFLNADIIITANNKKNFAKQSSAINVVKNLITNNNGVISTQVLFEYANKAAVLLNQHHSAILRQLKILEVFETINQNKEQIHRAVEIMHLYNLKLSDAMIISTAEQANCLEIYSQNLTTEPFYSGIKITNPLL